MNTNKLQRLVCGVLTVALVLTLTACGKKLNGTYVSSGLIPQTITFDGDKITLSAFGLNISGTYEIRGDTITVFYNLLGSELSLDLSCETSGHTLRIEGMEFEKQ